MPPDQPLYGLRGSTRPSSGDDRFHAPCIRIIHRARVTIQRVRGLLRFRTAELFIPSRIDRFDFFSHSLLINSCQSHDDVHAGTERDVRASCTVLTTTAVTAMRVCLADLIDCLLTNWLLYTSIL